MRLLAIIAVIAAGCGGTALQQSEPSSTGTPDAGTQDLGPSAPNLWPNSTSENDPPPGRTVLNSGMDPQYDFRYDAGAGAHDGNWIRRLTSSGPTPSGSPGTLLQIGLEANGGEVYSISSYIRMVQSGGIPRAIIGLQFFDLLGNELGPAKLVGPFPSSETGWTLKNLKTDPAPASTASVWIFFQVTTSTAGTAEAWVDSIVLQRL